MSNTSISVQHVSPDGEIAFIEEAPQSGLIYIGAAATDRIQIQANGYDATVAVLDVIQQPALLTCLVDHLTVSLNGLAQPLAAPISVTPEDELSIEGHTLFVLSSGSADVVERPVAVAAPVLEPVTDPTPNTQDAATTGLPVEALPEGYDDTSLGSDETSKVIVTRLPERLFETEVENEVEIAFTITNGGMLVGTFVTEVVGLNPDWITIDKPELNLFEGQKETVRITVTPTRSYESTAGEDYFSIWVTSPDYPAERAIMYGTIDIAPFREFTIGDMSPRDQTIRYRKNAGRVKFDVMNRGNTATDFLVKGSDGSQAIRFMFHMDDGMSYGGQTELRLEPGEKQQLDLELLPKDRKIFSARRQRHNFNIGVSILNGLEPPAERMGQASQSPLIGLPLMLLLLFCCVALLAYSFRPRIRDFGAIAADFPAEQVSDGSFGNPQVVNIGGLAMTIPSARNTGSAVEQTIAAGESVELSWDAPIFTQITIEPNIGKMEERSGTVSVSPLDTTVYTLEASNLISDFLPNLFGQSTEIRIVVEPIFPVVRMTVDREDILVGEDVELDWSVSNADEVFIVIDGAAETIPAEQHRAKRKITLQEDSTIAIKAINRYTDANGVSKSTQIVVSVPTPTPLPPVVLNSFNVEPEVVTKGQPVRLTWNVEGAESVIIEPLGEYPAQGSVEDVPQESLAYVLKATNGQQELNPALREVTVNLPPTPTPVPGAPNIEIFTISPDTVEKGSSVSQNVQLAWSVIKGHSDDEVTVQISGGTLGVREGLPLQGNLTVQATADTEFTLEAVNTADVSKKSSKAVSINVTVPDPVVTLLTPSLSTAVGASSLEVAVTGNNFVDGAKAQVNGQDRPTVFKSATELVVTLLASDLAAAADLEVGVVNPESAGGVASNTAKVSLQHPVPSLTAINPSSTVLDPDNVNDYVINITGTGFISQSLVMVNGTPVETTVGSDSQISAKIPASLMGKAAELAVAVENAAPGGGASASGKFTVNNPVPEMFSFSPSVVDVGDGPLTVKILGKNFVSDAIVRYDGTPVIANYVSTGVLEIQLLPEQIFYSATNHSFLVSNPAPGGGNAITTALSPSLFVVNRQNTTTTVVQDQSLYNPSPANAVVGEPITIKSTVTGANGNLQPEGEVKFGFQGINGIGTVDVPLTTGSASYLFASGAATRSFKVQGQYVPSTTPENFFSSLSTEIVVNLDPAYTSPEVRYSVAAINNNAAVTEANTQLITMHPEANLNSTVAPDTGAIVDASSQRLNLLFDVEGYVDSALTVSFTTLNSAAAINEGNAYVAYVSGSYYSPNTSIVRSPTNPGSLYTSRTLNSSGQASTSLTNWRPWYLGRQSMDMKYDNTAAAATALFLDSDTKGFVFGLRDTPIVSVSRGSDTNYGDGSQGYESHGYWTLDIQVQHHTQSWIGQPSWGARYRVVDSGGYNTGFTGADLHGDFQMRFYDRANGTWTNWYDLHDYMHSSDQSGDECLVSNINSSAGTWTLQCFFRAQWYDSTYTRSDGTTEVISAWTQYEDVAKQTDFAWRAGRDLQVRFVPHWVKALNTPATSPTSNLYEESWNDNFTVTPLPSSTSGSLSDWFNMSAVSAQIGWD